MIRARKQRKFWIKLNCILVLRMELIYNRYIFIVFKYEHKVYGSKKERTELSVSVMGIKVVHREEGKRNWITHHVNMNSHILQIICNYVLCINSRQITSPPYKCMFTCAVYVNDVSPPYLKSEISTLYNSLSLFFLFSPNNKFSKKKSFLQFGILQNCQFQWFRHMHGCMSNMSIRTLASW